MTKTRPFPALTNEEKRELKIRILTSCSISPTGCWEWRKSNSRGYGRMKLSAGGKRTSIAHRLSFYLWKKEPGHFLVLHHCDNPSCCNPHHLFLGNSKDNAQDRQKKGRSRPQNGEKNYMSKLTEDLVREIRRLSNQGASGVEIGKKFNISAQHVWKVLNTSWKHVKD